MDPFLSLSLIGGLLAVDDRAGWQSLLAQPIFAALLVGFVFGEVAVALPVGLILELVWLSILPMRGSRRPDQVLGAITGAGVACLLVKLSGDPRVLLASSVGGLIGLIAGELGGYLVTVSSGILNRRLSRVRFVAADQQSTSAKLSAIHAGAIGYIFVVEAVITFVFLTVGFPIAEWCTARIGGSFAAGIVSWSVLAPAIGAAAVVQLYWRPQLKRVLILSAVMVLLILWLR